LTRLGSYEIVREVGRGGLGLVLEARSPSGERVAVKLLARTDAASVARFTRERRLLGTFTEDSGFVPLLDAGESPSGPFIVMPFVTGGTLRDRLNGKPWPPERVAELGRTLGRALQEAHERGIVHRDLKPENILFTAEARPLIADLGLAKHFDRSAPGASGSLSLSGTGAFTGTAGYMPPEQMTDTRLVGPASDVFSLGAILYECLSGEPAFHAGSMVELLAKAASGSYEALGKVRPDAPAWLAQAIERALATDPADRFPDGGAFARALVPGAASRSRLVVAPVVFAVVAVGAAATGAALRFAPAAPRPHSPAAPPRPLAPPPRVAALTSGTDSVEDETRALIARGQELELAGQVNEALALLTRAVERAPRSALALTKRGAIRAKLGDFRGGLEDATRAIDVDSTLAIAWSVRGTCRGSLQDSEGEVDDQTRAIELDSSLAIAYCNRAVARGRLGDLEGQIADDTRAIEIDPGLSRAWYSRGYARSRKQDLAGAIADETRAIELDPSFADAFLVRGMVRLDSGDRAGRVDLEHGLELRPDGPNADHVRELLRKNP
jgi:serine/threonine-protein kinase